MTLRHWITGGSLAVALAAAALPAAGQEDSYDVVDRIVAIVGRTPIPASRIEERVQLIRMQNPQLPADSASLDALRRTILDTLIVEELLVQAAERDTMVRVSEEDVQGRADEQLRSIREQFVSELDFQRQIRASGFATVDEYRLWLSRDIRRMMLRDALLSLKSQLGDLRPIPPTETELRARFDEIVAQQQEGPTRPATVTFRQIVVKPEPDTAALREAFVRADSVLRRARAGEDFGQLALEFSDDSVSAQMGGDVGWFRRGVGFAKEFERVAFGLRPGQISNPVRTSFGFHIIQVVRAEPAEVQARHILFAPHISEAQRELARLRADSVAAMLRAGAALDSVLRRYHDTDEASFAQNAIEAQLPDIYREAVADANPGDVIGPITLPTRGVEKYAVILFQQRLEAGELTLAEIRDRLREELADVNGRQRYVEQLRRAAFVEIRY